jgi:pimeloyl-ACP methyl ester carboxylesterase
LPPSTKSASPSSRAAEQDALADAAAFYEYVFEVSRRLETSDNELAARLDSDLLRLHVGISELYAPAAPPREAIEQTCDEALFCSVPADVVYHDAWPRYAPPPDAWAWPATGVPILAMNGELDAQTPIEKAETIAAHLRAPAQNFVRMPFSTHAVMLNSPVKTAGLATCGEQMIDAFLLDPTTPPAAGCLADLVAPGFAGTSQIAEDFFKQSDVWENDPAPVPTTAALAAAGVARAR